MPLLKVALLKKRLAPSGLLGTANRTKALLKLVDASFSINELFLSSEEGMRICGHADRDDEVLYSVDLFSLIRLRGRAGEVASSTGHVLEGDRVVIWVNVFFHGIANFGLGATFPTLRGSYLTKIAGVSMGFRPRQGLFFVLIRF